MNYALEAITSMLQLGTLGLYQHRLSYTSIHSVCVLQSATVESVYHTQGTIEPNLWEFSYSLGELTMTVSHTHTLMYYSVLSTWVQSISFTL